MTMKEVIVTLPRLATAKEISEALGLSLARVYELARKGQMPVIRLGRAMRFDPRAVAQWLGAGVTAKSGAETAGWPD